MSLMRDDSSAGRPGKTERDLIETSVNRFFEGIRRLDCELVTSAFHPRSSSYSMTPNGICVEPFEAWEDLVRQAAEDPGHLFRKEFEAEIVSVDIAGSAASVKVEWNFDGTKVTDFYIMLKTDEGWLIVGQVYSVAG